MDAPAAAPPPLGDGWHRGGQSGREHGAHDGASAQPDQMAGIPIATAVPAPANTASTSESMSWLQSHAMDLIQCLRAWANDLDAREAQLNARSSLQDRRERQFHLQQQDILAELAEQQRAIARLRARTETEAGAASTEPPSIP